METIMSELCRKDEAYVAKEIARCELEIRKNPKLKLAPIFHTVMDKVIYFYKN
jgi:hypothetical protein